MKAVQAATMILSLVACTLLFSTSAKAEVVFHVREPVSGVVFDDCTGEIIMVDGEVENVITGVSLKDGITRYRVNIAIHGTATGLTTGGHYEYNENYHDLEFDSACGFSFASTDIARLISQGVASNERLEVTQTLSVDECGGTSSYTIDFEIKCHE